MSVLNLQILGRKLVEKRSNRGIREVSEEIGVSPSTLSRVENGHLPDLYNFRKICDWLKVDPSQVLGLNFSQNARPQVAVHFRKKQELSPKTAKSLANMILAARRAISLEEEG